MRLGAVAVRRERERLPIGREHRKAVEGPRMRDLLESGPIRVDEEKIELARARMVLVRGKDDLPPVGSERGGERGRSDAGQLSCVRAVAVPDPELELACLHEMLLQERAVLPKLLAGPWARR